MNPDKPNPASAAARTGSGDVSFGGEQFPDSAPAQKYQARILARRFGVRPVPPHLRLVPPVPSPRCRYETRIVVSAVCLPIGRSRVFRLAESDIDDLIAVALRMEARA
jgi:hypothetical protein